MSEKRKPGRPATGRDPIRHVRIDDERWGRVEQAATEGGTTKSGVVRQAIDEYLRKREK